MPRSLEFSHMGVMTTDPDRVAAFFVRNLGFTITDHGSMKGPGGRPLRLIFMSRDPEEHHEIVLCNGRPAGSVNTINQISLRADSLDTVRHIWRKVSADPEASDVKQVTHGNAVSVYFRDPEGNRCEAFIDTPWYVTQPMRVETVVDFSLPSDELMRRVEAHARQLPGFKSREQWVADMRARMAKAKL